MKDLNHDDSCGWVSAPFGKRFLVSVFGRMLTWHVGYRIFTWLRERLLAALRQQFFHQVNHLCLRFHIKRSSGELFSYLFGTPLAQGRGAIDAVVATIPPLVERGGYIPMIDHKVQEGVSLEAYKYYLSGKATRLAYHSKGKM